MGKLFVVSGHSGAGKTTIMRDVLGEERELVSTTTRAMRENEAEGKDYYFIDQDKFIEMKNNDEFAEVSSYYGSSLYGLTKEETDKKLSKGNAYVIVDFEGYKQLKKLYPDAVSIFIYTDKGTAETRMLARGDKRSSVDVRLGTYEAELMNRGSYDYVIRNVNFHKTVWALSAITQAEF